MAVSLRSLTWSVLGAVPLATPGAEPLEMPEPVVRVVFSCYAVQLPAEPLVYVARPGEAPTVVTLYRAGRSPRYEYTGPMPIRFFAGVHSPASGSSPADGALRLLAEARVPDGVKEALVLLAPKAEVRERSDEPPFQVLVLDDSAATFPPGCVRVYNASGHRLAARIGRSEHVLPAGPGPIIPADASVEIALRLQAGGRWHESYRGTLNLGGAGRCLLIILPPRYRGSPEVEVRVLRDEVKIPDDDPRG